MDAAPRRCCYSLAWGGGGHLFSSSLALSLSLSLPLSLSRAVRDVLVTIPSQFLLLLLLLGCVSRGQDVSAKRDPSIGSPCDGALPSGSGARVGLHMGRQFTLIQDATRTRIHANSRRRKGALIHTNSHSFALIPEIDAEKRFPVLDT